MTPEEMQTKIMEQEKEIATLKMQDKVYNEELQKKNKEILKLQEENFKKFINSPVFEEKTNVIDEEKQKEELMNKILKELK